MGSTAKKSAKGISNAEQILFIKSMSAALLLEIEGTVLLSYLILTQKNRPFDFQAVYFSHI
ncbi:hypothetical protein Ga0466249_005231 [Sporomusaceae bacterium BoRhaA]|nr:hypothetical protein [Pelorhabdus rhamnosifermentans]